MSMLFDPAAIEKKLDGLVSRTARAAQRTTLFSLVIICHKKQADLVSGLLDFLFGKRPLRIIRIENGWEGKTTIDVSARCAPHSGGQEVCFQEIVIYNGTDNRGFDPSIWSPLLIRDLPAVLLWLDDLEAFPKILADARLVIDKCIIDSGISPTPPDDPLPAFKICTSFLHMQAPSIQTLPLADLAWKRLEYSRHSVARLFDFEETLPLLGSIERAALAGFPPLSAFFIIFWIASRLGCLDGERQGTNILFLTPGGKQITFDYGDMHSPPAVTFLTQQKQPLSVTYTDEGTATFSIPGRVMHERLHKKTSAECLLEELDSLHSEPLYEDALMTAAQLF